VNVNMPPASTDAVM